MEYEAVKAMIGRGQKENVHSQKEGPVQTLTTTEMHVLDGLPFTMNSYVRMFVLECRNDSCYCRGRSRWSHTGVVEDGGEEDWLNYEVARGFIVS